MPHRCLAALLLALPGLLAMQCAPLRVLVTRPHQGGLVDDASVRASGSFGAAFFDVSNAEVSIDGVDLMAELALTPPFAGVSGVVDVGGQPIGVSGFRFELDAAGVLWEVELDLSGLPVGPHDFTLRALRTPPGELREHSSSFARVPPFTLEAEGLAASGLPFPLPAGSEGSLHSAVLGEPFAAAPVVGPGGSELRQGFVEVSEARIEGATP